jgi:hypothetical protein
MTSTLTVPVEAGSTLTVRPLRAILRVQRLEQSRFYFFACGSVRVPYHGSRGALDHYGHNRIIKGIEMICSHETGALRHSNVDAIRAPDLTEQLAIVRSTASGDIYALTESNFRTVFGWPMP